MVQIHDDDDVAHNSDDPLHEIDFDRSDGDTASQRSISLSSPARSPRHSHLPASLDAHDEYEDPGTTPVSLVRRSLLSNHRDSRAYTLDTDLSSEQDADGDDRSSFMRRLGDAESPISSAAPSLHEKETKSAAELEADAEEEKDLVALSPPLSSSKMSYPPPPVQKPDARESVASFASGSRK